MKIDSERSDREWRDKKTQLIPKTEGVGHFKGPLKKGSTLKLGVK